MSVGSSMVSIGYVTDNKPTPHVAYCCTYGILDKKLKTQDAFLANFLELSAVKESSQERETKRGRVAQLVFRCVRPSRSTDNDNNDDSEIQPKVWFVNV